MEKPLFVTNEDNRYNLKFLYDNVRCSEDVGTDNHVYLYYDNVNRFLRLLLTTDLEQLLKEA